MSTSLQTTPETQCAGPVVHIYPLFQAALIIFPVLQLFDHRLKVKVMLYRAEDFVRMGGDPGVMQQHRGTGEVMRNLQPSEGRCLSHAHSKGRGGGVGSWSWMCRGA